jgi:hypothetical protein
MNLVQYAGIRLRTKEKKVNWDPGTIQEVTYDNIRGWQSKYRNTSGIRTTSEQVDARFPPDQVISKGSH